MRNALPRALSAIAQTCGLAILAAAAAVGVFALVPFSSSGARGVAAGKQDEPALPGGARIAEELEGQRTASSRTYLLEDGRRLTKVFAGKVNYRDRGAWKPVDTTLLPRAGGGFEMSANDVGLTLPSSASGEVRVAQSDQWLAFKLRTARDAAPAASAASASYDDVLGGVDVEYTALADGVKESLILENRQAPARFEFDLRVADGLRPAQRGSGEIDLVAAGDHTAMSIAAPFMRDAAGAVSRAVDYKLERQAGGWALAVVADEGWLDDPARRYPVEVDPTVSVAPNPDCTIDAATPTTSLCAGSELEVGWNGSTDRRAVLKFDIASALPKGANVEYSYLALYKRSKTSSAAKDIGVYRMTRDWTSAASWNRYDGTNNWTTAGGDFDTSRYWEKSQEGTSPPGSYSFFGLDTGLVQGWRDGGFANNGLIVKDVVNNSVNNVLRFGATEQAGTSQDPYLGITWDHRLGEQRQFTLDTQGLSDRSQLSVNVANGNLIYRGNDVQIAGTGLDLGVSSVYNSLGSLWGPLMSGKQWNFSAGGGVFLWSGSSNTRVLFGPTGERRAFNKDNSGNWQSPTGIDATLTPDGAGFKLHFDKTAVDWYFNADGDLTKQRDRNGNEINYSYSSPTVLDEITDSQGRTITTTYTGSGRLQTMSDWAGRTWTYGYDGSQRLTSYTDPDNKTTSFTYTGGDDLATITDPRGKVTKLEYDANSRVTAIKRNYVQATNTWTSLTSYAYSSPTSPCSSTTDTFKTVVTDPRSNATTYCADHEARVTKVVDANGNTRTSTYTPNSDPDTTTAPGSATTTRSYTNKNLTSVTQPAGEVSSMLYGNPSFPRFLTQVTGPQETITKFGYNAQGNVATVEDGGSPATAAALEYNGEPTDDCVNDATTHAGTIRCAIDGNGKKTLYGYDDDGNLTSITPPSPLGDTVITYDSLSRVDTVEDGKGQIRGYSYDPLDRVTQITYSNGDTIDYDYDANGNLLERDDSVQGSSTYQYDALNRRTQDALLSGTTTYGWDASSNLTSLTEGGGTVTYRYDSVDRLQDLAEPGGSCTTPVSLCTTFTYTTRDQVDVQTFPNTVTQDFDYDASDKVTKIKAVKPGSPATTLTEFTYNYDRPAPSTAKSDLVQWVRDKDNNRTTYTYDALGRLWKAVEKASDGAGATLDDRLYEYDKASNRTKQIVNGATTTYKYNDANEICWLVAGTSANACGSPPAGAHVYTHDLNGNITASSVGLSLSYNIKDHTTSYTPPGGSATSFAYAGPSQMERTSLGGTAQHNTMLGLARQGTTAWRRDPAGRLIGQNAGGTCHYYLVDRLGSIVAMTDTSGTVAQSYKYEPYGLLRSSSGSVTNPFRFTGAYRTGSGFGEMYKLGARYYDPSIGRWTQQDPLNQAGDLREGNRYAYAAADPVNVIDPMGTCGNFSISASFDCLQDALPDVGVDGLKDAAVRCVNGSILGVLSDVITRRITKGTFIRGAKKGAGAIAAGVGCTLDAAGVNLDNLPTGP